MIDEMVIRHCAPTLAGLKTANMFNCDYETEEEMKQEIRFLNRRLSGKGIFAVPLRYSKRSALIYICRPDKLRADLTDSKAKHILETQGYGSDIPGCCIARLMKRLAEEEFPHEIGLFLGYPPEDVSGFIEKKACKHCGFWKVYGDVDKAKKTFAKYRKCMNIYLDQWQSGQPMERLTVAS